MKTLFAIPAAVVLLIVSSAGARGETGDAKNRVCDHEYALCTSAPCVPLPGDAKKAICSCVVEEGKSLSTLSCDRLKPSMDPYGIRTVYSAFSLQQFQAGMKVLKCPSGTAWTWCLNKRCTVNPADSKKAICTCDVVRTGEGLTAGGDCNTATCETAYWSAAPPSDFESGTAFMIKALGLAESPVKGCPAAQ
jgi:hypothetical protein